jgi:hypothetical protein
MRDVRCNGCPGLGEPTEINVEKIIDMAINKNKPCIKVTEGCKALAWKQGYCWKHHPDHVANKKAACADKQAIRDIHKATVAEQIAEHEGWEVIVAEPQVSDHEIHVINLLQVFKSKQAAELAIFANKLSQIEEPYDKLMFVYKEVQP